MEQEFYRDEFEQLLKDTTDDFKMYPSRKVWHSIYNDLHPDRKWPSFAVCLLLLTTILYIGVTNNNAISNKNKTSMPVDAFSSINNTTPEQTARNNGQAARIIPLTTDNVIAAPVARIPSINASPTSAEDAEQVKTIEISGSNNDTRMEEDKSTLVAAGEPAGSKTASFENSHSFTTTGNHTKINITSPGAAGDEKEPAERSGEAAVTINKDIPAAEDQEGPGKELETKITLNNLNIAANISARDTREQEWIEDFAFYNKSNSNLKNLFKGLSTQFYVTPSVGYRIQFRNSRHETIDNSLVTSNAARNSQEKVDLNQQAAMNMEAGVGITKDLNKKLRFKTGLQFNYTDYITYAQKLGHPTQTTVVTNSQGAGTGVSLAAYTADYAHMPGKNTSRLHNNTIQLSIPLGMDYKLLGNRTLNWYVGATVQPTLVARSNNYLLSSDNNYFVEESAMLRRWNLNGAVESFVSFKTPSGTFINLGPQFRYQLFSSYSKAYTYTEKPYNIGFKIGFTRPL